MAENLSNTGHRTGSWDAPAVGPVTEHATIGSSIVIKGEVSGSESLFIDGTVEGSIRLPGHRVTVGRGSQVKADIHAREVVVMGSVKGNIECADLLDVRAESNIQGEIVTHRIRIDDGAILKGSVEIQKSEKSAQVSSEPPVATAKTEPAALQSEPEKAEPTKSQVLAAAVAHRVAGSSVLWKPGR